MDFQFFLAEIMLRCWSFLRLEKVFELKLKRCHRSLSVLSYTGECTFFFVFAQINYKILRNLSRNVRDHDIGMLQVSNTRGIQESIMLDRILFVPFYLTYCNRILQS